MSSSRPRSENLKDILRAAHLLLQPPQPIPTGAAQLDDRVQASWEFLPHRWDTALASNPPGDNVAALEDSKSEVEELRSPSVALEHQAALLAEASKRFGARCLDLLLGLQAVLEKEYWPPQSRPGYETRDFLLGTADLRLVRGLITQSLALLKSQSQRYLYMLRSDSIADDSAAPVLKTILSAIMHLLCLPPPPSTGIPGQAGPSEARHLPPTTITQLLLSKHLAPILCSAILLGYNPRCPPGEHAQIRKASLSTLSLLPPSQALSALSGVLPLASTAHQPPYVAQTAQRQMSAQLLRPTGIQGLLLNLFGERARAAAAGADVDGIDQKKVDHAVAVLCRVPDGAKAGEYEKHVMREALEIMGVPKEGQGHAPRVFKIVLGSVVQKLCERSQAAKEILCVALGDVGLTPTVLSGRSDQDQEQARWRAIELLDTLIAFLDPAYLPGFLDVFVRPLLPSLAELYNHDNDADGASERSKRPGSAEQAGETATAERIMELAGDILLTWQRVMSDRHPSSPLTTGDPKHRNEEGEDDKVTRALRKLQLSSTDTTDAIPNAQSQTSTDEPLSEIDRIRPSLSSPDPPTRARALDHLSDLCSSPSTPDPTLHAALPLFISAIRDDEPFVHLKAISCVTDLADQHGHAVLAALIEAYMTSLDEVDRVRVKIKAGDNAESDIEAQSLRLAEALIGAVRRVEPELRPADDLLRLKYRLDDVPAGHLSDTLRTSIGALKRFL